MIEIYNFAIELFAPFVQMVLMLCVADWIIVMFKRAFN